MNSNKITYYIHNIVGDKMKELLWQLFRNTGKIEYYIKYRKELENERSINREKL